MKSEQNLFWECSGVELVPYIYIFSYCHIDLVLLNTKISAEGLVPVSGGCFETLRFPVIAVATAAMHRGRAESRFSRWSRFGEEHPGKFSAVRRAEKLILTLLLSLTKPQSASPE